MTSSKSENAATESETERRSTARTDARARRRPPDEREGADFDEWIAERVRRSTAAQGLPEFVEDPVIGETIARLMLD